MTPIILEVKQDLENDGWEDEDGTVHYDDKIVTPFGQLGSLNTVVEDDVITIIDAPEVILVRHGFPTQWSQDVSGVSMDTTPFGVQVMVVSASNGEVRYQLDPRPVRWSDKDENIPFYLAQLIHSDYEKTEE